MDIRLENLQPDCFYHIYNRGINGGKIFEEEKNYLFFMNKFLQYSKDVCNLYAYCLMPNHFHFVIKIKSYNELLKCFEEKNHKLTESGLHSIQNLPSKQFSKIFSSYTQAFNKLYNRHGALLESPFKRKKIVSERYLKNVIIYVHQNPIDIHENFKSYKFSSYLTVLSSLKTNLMRNDVIELFQSSDNFVFCHQILINVDL